MIFFFTRMFLGTCERQTASQILEAYRWAEGQIERQIDQSIQVERRIDRRIDRLEGGERTLKRPVQLILSPYKQVGKGANLCRPKASFRIPQQLSGYVYTGKRQEIMKRKKNTYICGGWICKILFRGQNFLNVYKIFSTPVLIFLSCFCPRKKLFIEI